MKNKLNPRIACGAKIARVARSFVMVFVLLEGQEFGVSKSECTCRNLVSIEKVCYESNCMFLSTF